MPRAGDELVKQQVEYRDAGRDGENVIWDFSSLKPVNDQYIVVYSAPGQIGDSVYVMGMDTIKTGEVSANELIIGMEHNTMYYYRLSENGLYTLGHENPTTLLKYTHPLLNMVYPFNYTNKREENYASRGVYSSSVGFETEGKVTLEADAEGMMILPGGDTLRNVLRIKTVQLIPKTDGNSREINTVLENYRWYSRGYRYPVFETVKISDKNGDTAKENFGTAFFYPPQDHYYLEDDDENLALQEKPDDLTNPWAGLKYNFYPNPVATVLSVDLYMPRPAKVTVLLRTLSGLTYINENKGMLSAGMNHFSLDISRLPTGNYVLSIRLDDYVVSGVIVKR
jgi:hypothetical protein